MNEHTHSRRTRDQAAGAQPLRSHARRRQRGPGATTSRSTPRSTASASSCSRCSAAPASSSTSPPRSSCPTRARRTRSCRRRSESRRDRPWPLIGLGLARRRGRRPALARDARGRTATRGSCCSSPGVAILWITRHGTAERDDGRGRARRSGLASHPPLLQVGSCSRSPSLVALVLVAAAIFASVVHVHVGRGVGDRDVHGRGRPGLAGQLPARHRRPARRPQRREAARRRDACQRTSRRRQARVSSFHPTSR